MALAEQLGLETDSWCGSVFSSLYNNLTGLTQGFNKALTRPNETLPLWKIEDRYRVLFQMQSALGLLFERVSASYDQSRRDWFFDTRAQNGNAVNYDRYGLGDLRDVELRFLDVLRLGGQTIDLLLTSSGMAAFQIIQQYLLHRLPAGSIVVLPPYIYFEAMELLQSLTHIQIQYAPTFKAEDKIATANLHNASVVFVDPVANVVGLPPTDLRTFARIVTASSGWSDRCVVVDGTMASGAMPVHDWFNGPTAPKLLYYESASKYLQFGLDVQMAGLVAYPAEMDMEMRTIRRNTGSVMYSRNASLLPPIDFVMYQTRMSLLTSNASRLSHQLSMTLSPMVECSFPTEWEQYGSSMGGDTEGRLSP